jgi:ATP-binding cassette subfamily B protein
MTYVLDYIRRSPGAAALIVLGLLIEMAFNAAVPFSFKFIVDRSLIGGDRTFLFYVLAILTAGAVLVPIAGLTRDYLYARMQAKILSDIRESLFNHFQRLSTGFYARAQRGDLMSRFSSDLAAVEQALAAAIPWGVTPLLDVIATATLLFFLDWRLALVAMLIFPVCLIGPRFFTVRTAAASFQRRQDEGTLVSMVQENFATHRVIAAFGLANHSLERFRGQSERLAQSMLRVGFLGALIERSAGIGIMIIHVAVLGIGSHMAFMDQLTIGSLASFLALFLTLSASLLYVMQYIPNLAQASAGMKRVRELLTIQPEVIDMEAAQPLPRLARSIEFSDVRFGYTSSSMNLTDVSLQITKGSTVAFVGSSGAGKSTILQLIMRFYDPQAGSVNFDGQDLQRVTTKSLRSQIGVVFQDSLLFNMSIRENIRMGNLVCTDAAVEEAARLAEVHDFVRQLHDGYETVIGEGGAALSGGQKQRIAIARALVRQPEIIILDEATSALDPATEAAINETLERVGKSRTVIWVTHRLAAVVHADRIFVLEAGRILESGTHEDLLAAGEAYWALWQKQSGFRWADDGDRVVVERSRLARIPLLADVDVDSLEHLTHLFVTEKYPASRVVIHQGDVGDRFYLIVRGTVGVYRAAADGAEAFVSRLQDGDYFGEIALLKKIARTASVKTETPCIFLSLQREQFAKFLQEAPHLHSRLEQAYKKRITELGIEAEI